MKIIALALAGTIAAASPLWAQDTAPAAGGATATATAAKPNVTVGSGVSDSSGASVGTVESVSGGNAVVSTGTAKASIPVSSFAQGPNGLVIGMTKAQLEAAVSNAKPADIAVGTAVQGPKGGSIGTVSAVAGNLVTVQTATGKVQVPKTAFAQGQGSALVLGMTAEQLDAAAKAASGNGGA